MKKRAFTLIELLVVISILSILAMVSIFGYSTFIKKAKYSNAQTELKQIVDLLNSEMLDGRKHEWTAFVLASNFVPNVYYYADETGTLLEEQPKKFEEGFEYYINSSLVKYYLEYSSGYYIMGLVKRDDIYSEYNKVEQIKEDIYEKFNSGILLNFLTDASEMKGKLTIKFKTVNIKGKDYSTLSSFIYELDGVKCLYSFSSDTYIQVY